MHLRGIGYALASAVMFGLGVVLAQLLGKEIDAIVAAVLCLLTGGLLLTAGLLLMRVPLLKELQGFKRRDWVDLFLLSCPGTALPLVVIVAGFARTSALVGGFLLQFIGVAGLLFAVVLLKERIGWKQSIGIALLLIGGVLVVLKGTQGMAWGSGGLGDLLILLGAVGIGFSIIPAKRLTLHIDTLPLTGMRLIIGGCTLLPVLAFQLIVGASSIQWQPSFLTLWLVLPAYIITNFCLGYLAQQEGLRLLKAWEMAAITQSVPLFSTVFALLLLHDTLTLVQAVGGLIATLGGVVVSLNGEAPAIQPGVTDEL